jgi:hypothetical protein
MHGGELCFPSGTGDEGGIGPRQVDPRAHVGQFNVSTVHLKLRGKSHQKKQKLRLLLGGSFVESF